MPTRSIASTYSGYAEPLSQLSRFLTPKAKKKTKRKVFDALDYEDVHRSIAESQWEYIGWPRKNSVCVRSTWFRKLAPCEAHLLCAANLEARIRFAKIAVHEAIRFFEDHNGPVFFFSVTPRRYVVPLHQAHLTDLHGLKKLTCQAFSGCSIIGSTHFALLKGFGKRGVRGFHNKVSTHTHGYVWGKSEDDVRAGFRTMGPDFVNLKGECAGYIMEIDPDEIAGYLRYTLSIPLFEENVTESEEAIIDRDTGEVTRAINLSTNPLRPGDQLRMSALLSDMYLDELFFGQHDGTAIVREVVRRAREPLVYRNRISAAQGHHPSTQIPIGVNIAPVTRSSVSDLVRSPSRTPWLGDRLMTAGMDSMLSDYRLLLSGQYGSVPSPPGLVLD